MTYPKRFVGTRGLIEGVLEYPSNAGGVVFDMFKNFNRIFYFGDLAIIFDEF